VWDTFGIDKRANKGQNIRGTTWHFLSPGAHISFHRKKNRKKNRKRKYQWPERRGLNAGFSRNIFRDIIMARQVQNIFYTLYHISHFRI
jgi:hypothetical protein